MSETKIKKLNLKALQNSGEERIKEEKVSSTTKESTSKLKNTLDISSNTTDTGVKDVDKKISTTKISIASIKKAPIKKDVPKKEETTQSTDNASNNSKEDKEKDIVSSSKIQSLEIEEPKNNNTSVNQDIKKDTSKLQGSDKDPSQEKNLTAKDANKQKNSVNENFKEEMLSENEQQEIIEKTLKEEKSKKKGIFSRIFSRKKKYSTVSKKSSNKVKQENKEIHFENYTSDFEQKSRNILKRVQNFKYAPKTRKGLVLGLISLTFLIIGGLMVLFPEKHSLEIYKASILEITHKKTETPSIQENNKIQTIAEPENNIKIDVSIPEKEPGKTGKSTILNQEEENKEKLRNYLLDIYKK